MVMHFLIHFSTHCFTTGTHLKRISFDNRVTKIRLFRGIHFALEISNSGCSEVSSQTSTTVTTVSKNVLILCDILWSSFCHIVYDKYFFIVKKGSLPVLLSMLCLGIIFIALCRLFLFYMGSLEHE